MEEQTTNNIFISTAIPYVNSAPHVGFSLEVVLADIHARRLRLDGHRVHLQGGTDDNSLKNVKAAEEAGIATPELVARNVETFRRHAEVLGVAFDGFVSTSSDARHRDTVEALWRACAENDDLYRKTYEGLYCVGCEQYYDPAELSGGCCPEHGTRPESVKEENWFFSLSRYGGVLLDLVEQGRLSIEPQTRRNEILAFLRSGLDDLCVSRSAVRAKGWGIPVPDDATQVVYVWFDALANYLTGAGFGDAEVFEAGWTGAAERCHHVGKGITRFHAVYWPAILLSAGIAPPTRILVHGYVTVDGRKIGKSNGNAVDPFSLVERYGSDAVRWYLARHIRANEDADFSEERLVAAHDGELAGQIGNLLSRLLSLQARRAAPIRTEGAEGGIAELSSRTELTTASAIRNFAIHDAAGAVTDLAAAANRHIADKAPWTSLKQGDLGGFDVTTAELFGCLRAIARCLEPITPGYAARLAEALDRAYSGDFSPTILFPKIGARPDHGVGASVSKKG